MGGGTRNERVIVDIIVKSQGATRALKNMDKSLQSVEKSSRRTANHMQFLRDVTGLATMAIMLHDIAKAFLAVNIAQQRIEKGFTAVTGSAQAATQELAYTSEVAERLGLNFYDVSQAWIGVMAAAKGSTITTQEARTVFEAFSGAMSKLGKSAEDVKGVLLAVQQIFSKGVISAEEWKNQIGERLPGAMALLADSLKKTTGEVTKMMEAGEVNSKQLVRVAEDLEDLYDTGDRMEGLIQDWNRLKNAIDRVMVEIGKSGVIDVLTRGLGNLAANIAVLSNMSEGLSLTQAQLVVQYDELEGAIPGMALLNAQLGNAYEDLNATLGKSGNALQDTAAWLEKVVMGEDAHAKVVKEKTEVVEKLEKAIRDLNEVTDERRRKLELVNEAEAESARMKEYEIQRTKDIAKEEKERAKNDRNHQKFLTGTRRFTSITNDLQDQIKLKGMSLRLDDDELKIAEARLKLASKIGDLRARGSGLNKDAQNYKEYLAMWNEVADAIEEGAPNLLQESLELDKLLEKQQKIERFADDIAGSMTGAFENIVMGTESVSEAFETMARSIVNSMMKTAVFDPIGEGIGTFLTTAITGASTGGFTTAGVNNATSSLMKGVTGGATWSLPSANGNAFSGPTGLAHGVYSQPTAFPINGGGRFANGVGIMGEAGAEAILPLTRRGGKLGVEGGGGGVNISVHNYSGGEVQTRQGINPGDIDIIVGRVSSDIARGGSLISRSMEGAYGLTRGRLRG